MIGFSNYDEDDYTPEYVGHAPYYGFGNPIPGLEYCDNRPELIPTHVDGLGSFNIKRIRG